MIGKHLQCEHDDLHAIRFGEGLDNMTIFTKFATEEHRNRFLQLVRDSRLGPVTDVHETQGIFPRWVYDWGLLTVYTICCNVLQFRNPTRGL